MNFTQGILKKIKHCIVSSLLIFKINPFWGPVLGFRCCPGFPLVAVRGGHSLPWCQGSRERAQQLWLMGLTAPQPVGPSWAGDRTRASWLSCTGGQVCHFLYERHLGSPSFLYDQIQSCLDRPHFVCPFIRRWTFVLDGFYFLALYE